MKTQDTAGTQSPPPAPARSKGKSWLAGMGAMVVVVLVISASTVIFAQLSQRKNPGAQTTPPAGKWAQVLNGYTITSLAAVRSTPSMLYACATQYQPGTASSNNQSGAASNPGYTVLRSTDFGAHWQDIGGSKTALGAACQIALNPADGNDIYALGAPTNGQSATVLKHSTNGGQTWTSITPHLNTLQGVHSTPIWNVQQLSIEGNHLFGVQWVPQRGPLPAQSTPPQVAGLLSRLITSVDGGHTWTVLDKRLATANQGARAYAVDPADSSSVYELVGSSWLPIAQQRDVASVPSTGLNEDLYKTTDNGATWHLLLSNLPYGTLVQLASGKPEIIYVGGSIVPVPYVAHVPTYDPIAADSFHLQVSRDSGATWHDVPNLPQTSSIQNWYAGPDGQVYVYSASVCTSTEPPQSSAPCTYSPVEPTAISGMAVPATPVRVPSSVPVGSAANSRLSVALRPTVTPSPGVTPGQAGSMQRYDPAANQWSELSKAPTNGVLLTVTPVDANSGAVLWFSGTSNGQVALYRYVK